MPDGNADFRIELSDVYVGFMDICYAVAKVTWMMENANGQRPVAFNDEDILNYVIANL